MAETYEIELVEIIQRDANRLRDASALAGYFRRLTLTPDDSRESAGRLMFALYARPGTGEERLACHIEDRHNLRDAITTARKMASPARPEIWLSPAVEALKNWRPANG